MLVFKVYLKLTLKIFPAHNARHIFSKQGFGAGALIDLTDAHTESGVVGEALLPNKDFSDRLRLNRRRSRTDLG